MKIDFDRYNEIVDSIQTIKSVGRVVRVVGLTIESSGPLVHLGEHCYIKLLNSNKKIDAEVVGFNDNKVLLMPLGDMKGIGHGCEVIPSGRSLSVGVSKKLLGRVIDGLGNPIDDKGKIEIEKYMPLENQAPNPLARKRITEPLNIGVRAIDANISCGKGQRIGIFAGSGVGKSTLLGMISRNSSADINVIALIGERGREVREFIEKDLGEKGMKNTVVVVATSDQPALVRLKGASTATAIAEYFRDKGYNVMLMMDSLTRFAMAQREIGLAVGEPPATRGYTPSVFAELPKLLERTGNSDKGTITGLYTVLVDGDDLNDPIADTVRGILDGHIVLSRKMAEKNHYPAIDVLASVSRVINNIVSKEHLEANQKLREVLATYNEVEDLISIGAYKQGSNPKVDYAISKIEEVNNFLKQGIHEESNFEDTKDILINLFN
ncbi:type III secretion system FliI/YscN family ATPase [Hypnocyclicus thermotrophus]|uniref:Type 3 secretion system ATPase n=1 Tax=Hypnocyclicus thermotrophus TaxID=1627895 RepID=A0AA46I573_9FUSO|nr:flagellar protein export ATPase FliI [Hypnocyclicus thermotrophus]TDT69137.1 type III secretion system FliI/YscN family ATPase [Hypnocyclicus thermotrophus]